MYCGRCGTPLGGATNCPSCGEPAAPLASAVPPPPPIPPTPPGSTTGLPPNGGPSAPSPSDASGKKLAAGICGILLGSLGIHKFVLGYTKEGLIMLLVTILTCGIAGIVFGVIGLVEGILYLTKSDDEFYRTYMVGRKGWF